MGTTVSARGAHPDHKSPEGSSAIPPVGSLRPFQEIHEIKTIFTTRPRHECFALWFSHAYTIEFSRCCPTGNIAID